MIPEEETHVNAELMDPTMDDTLIRPAGWTPRGGDLLPLWLSQGEAEAVLQLCAASTACAGEGTEDTLFGKLGQLLRAFQR